MEAVDTTKYRKKSLVITGLGTFLGTLDSSIVNVSLPSISRDLNTTVDMVGWVVLSYAITIITLLMLFGSISSRKGFQFSYRYGFAIFLLGSLSSGLSPTIYILIIARAFQGIGAALMMSVGPALVTQSFPASERGRSLSVIAMVVSTGLLLGPPLGGFIIGLFGWRWIFFVNIPVCIAGVYFTQKFISDFPILDPERKIPVPGASALALGLLTMMISLMIFSKKVISLPVLIGLLSVAVLFFILFLYFESNPKTQLIGLKIFKNRVFSLSAGAMLMVFIALASVTVLIPFFLEKIWGLQPQEVGLYLMIIPVCILFVAPLAGYLSDKVQARIITTIGIAIMTVGLYLTRELHADSTSFEVIRVLILIGIGMGLFSTPNTSSIMGSVDKEQLGTASGINATIRTLGIAFGVSIAISIFEYFRSHAVKEGMGVDEAFMFGYHTVYKYIIYIVLAAVIVSWFRGNDKDPISRGPGING